MFKLCGFSADELDSIRRAALFPQGMIGVDKEGDGESRLKFLVPQKEVRKYTDALSCFSFYKDCTGFRAYAGAHPDYFGNDWAEFFSLADDSLLKHIFDFVNKERVEFGIGQLEGE